jgi:hypothetical protein
MAMKDGNFLKTAAPAAALLLGLLCAIIAFYPVLAPLLDGRLQFTYGDLNSPYGTDSAAIRKEWTFNTFDQGSNRIETNRFYPIAALSALSDWVELSESQVISTLIVLSMALGGLGIYLIAKGFIQDWRYSSAAILALVPFYFLNLWSVERLCHVWIWFTYAVFPLLLALGFMFLRDGKRSRLIAYSLLLAFFGFPPHSLIYLLFFHAFIIAFAILAKKKRSDAALLAIVPLVIYALINLPPLTLGESLPGNVVAGIGGDSLGLLSRNGELSNLFAFSNNWWYQVSRAAIYSNPAFTCSSIGIFAVVLLALGLSYGRMGREGMVASILALAFVLAVMFIAQGVKNGILAPALREIADSFFSAVLRPFREWARVSILIPPLIAVILASCLNDRGIRLPLIACFSALVIANIAVSPSWAYLSDVHAATFGIDDFQHLKEALGPDSKTIWPGTNNKHLPAVTASGKNTSTNTDIRRISGVANLYYPAVIGGYENKSSWKVAPRPLMDALNIRDVITLDAPGEHAGYGWMDCSDIGSLTLCHDGNASTPLRIYDGAIVATAASMEPMFHIPLEDYALTGENVPFGGYSASAIGDGASNGSVGRIYVIEAESGLKGDKHAFISPEASNRTAVYFPGILRTAIDAPEDGDYGIALIGNGSFDVSAGGRNFSLMTQSKGYTLGGPFHLGKGAADIGITRSKRGENLDAVVVYRMKDGGPFAAGTPAPATIDGYASISPTEWRMNISARKQFLLAFAETYDPGWVADVYKDGAVVKTIRTTSLYNNMNGYWIDETGELEVVLRYEPQEMFERTMIVSMAAILASAGLLALAIWKEVESDGKD